jgi:hypothetical protein
MQRHREQYIKGKMIMYWFSLSPHNYNRSVHRMDLIEEQATSRRECYLCPRARSANVLGNFMKSSDLRDVARCTAAASGFMVKQTCKQLVSYGVIAWHHTPFKLRSIDCRNAMACVSLRSKSSDWHDDLSKTTSMYCLTSCFTNVCPG